MNCRYKHVLKCNGMHPSVLCNTFKNSHVNRSVGRYKTVTYLIVLIVQVVSGSLWQLMSIKYASDKI